MTREQLIRKVWTDHAVQVARHNWRAHPVIYLPNDLGPGEDGRLFMDEEPTAFRYEMFLERFQGFMEVKIVCEDVVVETSHFDASVR